MNEVLKYCFVCYRIHVIAWFVGMTQATPFGSLAVSTISSTRKYSRATVDHTDALPPPSMCRYLIPRKTFLWDLGSYTATIMFALEFIVSFALDFVAHLLHVLVIERWHRAIGIHL